MRRIGVWLLFAACVLAFASQGYAATVGVTEEQVRPVGEAVLDNVLEGLGDNNYQKYTRDFDDFLREAMPEKKFLQISGEIQEAMGTCTSREYLGFLNKGEMTVVLWKGTFSGTAEDILMKLVLSKRGDTVVVTGLWFQ